MRALALAALLLITPVQAEPIDVDLALVLAVDTSDSIDDSEFALQRIGIAAAFTDAAIIDAIKAGALGRVVVTVVDFADDAKVSVPWTIVSNADTAKAFATSVVVAPRASTDNTSVSAGLTLAAQLIGASPYRATRRVIDVSGDGSNNRDWPQMGTSMESARTLVKALKITVNGLPILDTEPGVEGFYHDYVLTGPGAFLIPAANSNDFARAIRRKLIREIS